MSIPATFGQRLKAARIMAGLSMDDLVEHVENRLSKAAISKYENDLMKPDSENLMLLADALDVAPDFFFSERVVELSQVNFRKKASLGKKQVESLTERVRDAVDRYLQLESLLGLAGNYTPPLSDTVVREPADIEESALELRRRWDIGLDGAIPHVIDLLEEHAGKVLELEEAEGFDGISGMVDGNPFIVLNKKCPTDRKRLTALHEFAHQSIVFHQDLSDASVEKLCHTFGGAFLLPADVLRRELGDKRSEVSLYELRALKEQYGISMQAIMYRAKLHGIITEYVYERFSKYVSIQGWRKAEPVPYLVHDTPHRFEQLLHRALAEGVITIAKAAYLASRSIPELEQELVIHDANPHS